MRVVVALLLVVTLVFAGCVEEEPECPDDQDEPVQCTCEDGTQGELECTNGDAICVCDDDETDDDT